MPVVRPKEHQNRLLALVVAEGGQLRYRVTGPTGTQEDAALYVLDMSGEVFIKKLVGLNQQHTLTGMAPGRYRTRVELAGREPIEKAFTIHNESTTVLVLGW